MIPPPPGLLAVSRCGSAWISAPPGPLARPVLWCPPVSLAHAHPRPLISSLPGLRSCLSRRAHSAPGLMPSRCHHFPATCGDLVLLTAISSALGSPVACGSPCSAGCRDRAWGTVPPARKEGWVGKVARGALALGIGSKLRGIWRFTSGGNQIYLYGFET